MRTDCKRSKVKAKRHLRKLDMEKMVSWSRGGLGRRWKVERCEVHFGVRVTRFADGRDVGSEGTYKSSWIPRL